MRKKLNNVNENTRFYITCLGNYGLSISMSEDGASYEPETHLFQSMGFDNKQEYANTYPGRFSNNSIFNNKLYLSRSKNNGKTYDQMFIRHLVCSHHYFDDYSEVQSTLVDLMNAGCELLYTPKKLDIRKCKHFVRYPDDRSFWFWFCSDWVDYDE